MRQIIGTEPHHYCSLIAYWHTEEGSPVSSCTH